MPDAESAHAHASAGAAESKEAPSATAAHSASSRAGAGAGAGAPATSGASSTGSGNGSDVEASIEGLQRRLAELQQQCQQLKATKVSSLTDIKEAKEAYINMKADLESAVTPDKAEKELKAADKKHPDLSKSTLRRKSPIRAWIEATRALAAAMTALKAVQEEHDHVEKRLQRVLDLDTLEELQAEVQKHTGGRHRLSKSSGHITGGLAYVKACEIKGEVTGLKGDVSGIKADIAAAKVELNDGMAAVKAEVKVEVKDSVATATATLQAGMCETQAAVTTIATTQAELKSGIAAVVGEVTGLKGDVASVKAHVSTVKAELQGTVDARVGKVEERLTTIESGVSDVKTGVATVKAALQGTVDARVGKVEERLTSIEASVAALVDLLKPVAKEIAAMKQEREDASAAAADAAAKAAAAAAAGEAETKATEEDVAAWLPRDGSTVVGDRVPAVNLAQLKAWVQEVKPAATKLRLLYRQSRDGTAAADFHRCCDGKGATVVLCHDSDTGCVFGGFTSVAWTGPSRRSLPAAPGSFLFRLVSGRDAAAAAERTGSAFQKPRVMYHHATYGPAFGGAAEFGCAAGFPKCKIFSVNEASFVPPAEYPNLASFLDDRNINHFTVELADMEVWAVM